VVTLRRWVLAFWLTVKPPSGCELRRYAGLFLIGLGLIRILRLPSAGSSAMDWLPFQAYAVIKITLGLLLMMTNHQRRLTMYGKATTVVALGFCSMAAFDALPYVNGAWIYLMLVWVMLGEAWSRREC
jgi:hypothetical protein